VADLTAKQLAKILKKASPLLDDAIRKALHKSTLFAVGELDKSTRKHLNKHGQNKSRKRSAVSGSSGLAGSFKAQFTENKRGDIIEMGAYSHLPYASIHEEGGKITAKNKLLTIPLTDAAREYPVPLFFLRSQKKHISNVVGVLAEETNDPKSPVKAVYALAKWVTIPPTYYIIKAARKLKRPLAQIAKESITANVLEPITRGKV
jgi:phage gpG-like protein